MNRDPSLVPVSEWTDADMASPCANCDERFGWHRGPENSCPAPVAYVDGRE